MSSQYYTPYVSVPVADRSSSKPARTALGPVESNTSSFADYGTPTDCRPRSFAVEHTGPFESPGIYLGDATIASTASPSAVVQYQRPYRYRHDVYGMTPHLADSNWVCAPAWRGDYRWCGPRAVPVADVDDVADVADVAETPAAPVAAPVAPAAQDAPAAVPRRRAHPTYAYAAAVTANLDISSVSCSSNGGPPQNEYYRNHGVNVRNAHDTSLSSDVSEPSQRPRPDGRRVVAVGTLVATVRFRYRVGRFLVSADLARRCLPGSVVMVEGDRGEDAGTIKTVSSLAATPDAGRPTLRVLRMAMPEETAKLRQMNESAEHAKTKVAEVLQRWISLSNERRGITLLDVEFQFDGGKLFVHYEAKARVAFKDLATTLFQHFRCRVWMNQLNYDTTAFNSTPTQTASVRNRTWAAAGSNRRR